MVGAAGIRPSSQKYFFQYFQIVSLSSIFSGTVWGLVCQNLNFYLAKLYSIWPLDILNFHYANNDWTPKSYRAQLSWRMVQKGDYLETLFRPGDCTVGSRNLLKYLKKQMVEAAGVEPASGNTPL